MAKTKRTRSNFRPRARILRSLGDELISSETVAVIELVKNAYDADATRVLVKYRPPLKKGKGSIEIIDNGHGMDVGTIKTGWLEPATLSKLGQTYTESGRRRLLGEKGIGRFAAQKLTDKLELITRRRQASREIVMKTDWARFEDPDKYLDEITVSFRQRKVASLCKDGLLGDLRKMGVQKRIRNLNQGTILRMDCLRGDWNKEMFERLRRGLSRLISPFSNIADFHVELEVPAPFENLSGLIGPSDILYHPIYVIKGTVDERGKYRLKLILPDRKRAVTKTDIFLITSNDDPDAGPEGRQPLCGPFELEFRIWDRGRDDIKPLADILKSTVRDVRKDLDDAAGVNVYRDGFRVLPYGEPGNDWLKLDSRRVDNPTLRLSNNQIVGYLFISADKNPELRDQTNREGLLEGRALEDLKRLVLKVLALIEAPRYKYREPIRSKKRTGTGLFGRESLAKVRKHTAKKYPDDKRLQDIIESTETDLEKHEEEVQEVLARYRRLATLGQLVDIILHEGRTPTAKIRNQAQEGCRDVEENRVRLALLSDIFFKRFDIINKQGGVLADGFRRIAPFGGRKPGRPQETVLERIIQDTFDIFRTEAEEKCIMLDLPSTTNYVTVASVEISQVLVNLILNSLYWLTHVPAKNRSIRVRIHRRSEKGLSIIFSDSGPGVPEEIRDHIFEPYFSTKPNGIGLGLAIAGEIVTDYYNGALELLDTGPLPGATFRVVLRKRV